MSLAIKQEQFKNNLESKKSNKNGGMSTKKSKKQVKQLALLQIPGIQELPSAAQTPTIVIDTAPTPNEQQNKEVKTMISMMSPASSLGSSQDSFFFTKKTWYFDPEGPKETKEKSVLMRPELASERRPSLTYKLPTDSTRKVKSAKKHRTLEKISVPKRPSSSSSIPKIKPSSAKQITIQNEQNKKKRVKVKKVTEDMEEQTESPKKSSDTGSNDATRPASAPVKGSTKQVYILENPNIISTRKHFAEIESEGLKECRVIYDKFKQYGLSIDMDKLKRALLPPNEYRHRTYILDDNKLPTSTSTSLLNHPCDWLPRAYSRLESANKNVEKIKHCNITQTEIISRPSTAKGDIYTAFQRIGSRGSLFGKKKPLNKIPSNSNISVQSGGTMSMVSVGEDDKLLDIAELPEGPVVEEQEDPDYYHKLLPNS